MVYHWVIQSDLLRERWLLQLIWTLERADIPYTCVEVDPSARRLHPGSLRSRWIEPEPGTGAASPLPVMAIGGTSMLEIARTRGWQTFTDNLDFRSQQVAWGSLLFNADSRVMPLGAVMDGWAGGSRFIRPVNDGKAFTGGLFDRQTWQETMETMEARQRDPARAGARPGVLPLLDLPVQVAAPKKIYTEHRLWVVDGCVATASGYRRGGQLFLDGWGSVDPAVLDFGRAVIRRWVPDRAFCLDIFEGEDGFRIGEVNCIQSSGFYGADVQRIVDALERTAP